MLKTLRILLVAALVFFNIAPGAFAQFGGIEGYLCEIGQQYYQEGNYANALNEFKKVLILNPGSRVARGYIDRIEAELTPQEEVIIEEQVIAPEEESAYVSKEIRPASKKVAWEEVSPKEIVTKTPAPSKSVAAILPRRSPKEVILSDDLRGVQPQTIEIEVGKSLRIRGNNISRWLATSEQLISVERENTNEISITGEEIGSSYFYVWDNSGRWAFNAVNIQPKPEGPTYEEQMRQSEERAGAFKITYDMDWESYERGRRLSSLRRLSYRYLHYLYMTGETPYGNLDSSITIQSLSTSTDLTYATIGLVDGKYGPFKGFTLRGLDYSPPVGNMSWGGASLRGVMFQSPAFDKKIDYTVFWGQEGGGRYGNLSPGLDKIRKSYLAGFDFNLNAIEKQNYGFSLFHGWGSDRPKNLRSYAYDFDASYILDKWKVKYELAHNTDVFSSLLNASFGSPKIRFTTELRDIDKNFNSIMGNTYRAGELGVLSTIQYAPVEKLSIYGLLDVYRDRLYPATDNRKRWNEDLNLNANYTIDPLTSIRADYNLQNDLGRMGQFRYQNGGVGVSRTFNFIRQIIMFANYHHQENKNYSTPSLDYINDKINLGVRFSIIGDLYYYFNRELNWLDERQEGNHSKPNVLETGVDWNGQILKSPFYGIFRFFWRDEEDAASNLSFLSGEDYIEGYSELSYRPNPEQEVYCSARVRNNWAENANVSKYINTEFRGGVRYTWNTGVRWDPVGYVDGYVFRDDNSDGLMQRDDAPVEGVKVYLGKDRFAVTDILGYYYFSGVRARKVHVSIDNSTLPPGYILTVPSDQETAITHGEGARVNFGIGSRTEIAGMVFEDTDGDGGFSAKDIGVPGVVLKLEDGSKTTTDEGGRYSFRKISVGKHTITLDLGSLPVQYVPKVPIFKEVEVFESISYLYNIPLKKSQ